MASFEDCANQRPLTDKGRDEARAIAGHLKRLRIPIDRVYASPFCRTVETAMLAFGKAEKTQEARGGPLKSDDPKRYDALRKLLSTPPAAGRTTPSPATATPSTPCSARPTSPKAKSPWCARGDAGSAGGQDQARGLAGVALNLARPSAGRTGMATKTVWVIAADASRARVLQVASRRETGRSCQPRQS